MNNYFHIILLSILSVFLQTINIQKVSSQTTKGKLRPVCVYKGDTIPYITLNTVYIYPRIKFKNEKERRRYNKLVRDVKKTLPLAKEIRRAVIETYEYLETLPNEEMRKEHLKNVEKGLKKQYTPKMKKLTFAQGKLLIKLVDRECNSSSYQLVKSFMGSFKAGFYQTFAALFGASLKKEYHPEDKDKSIEKIVILVENGQL